jgi:hypothetical protein
MGAFLKINSQSSVDYRMVFDGGSCTYIRTHMSLAPLRSRLRDGGGIIVSDKNYIVPPESF